MSDKAKPTKKGKKRRKEPSAPAGPPQVLPPDAKPSILDQIGSKTLSSDAIKNLDTGALRENMLRGIYMLESLLFSQAGFEFDRVLQQRKLLAEIEKEILSDKGLAKLSQSQKVGLYHTVSSSMGSSMSFLRDLHGSVTSGLAAIDQIDRIKHKPKNVTRNDPKVAQYRAMILTAIEAKLKKAKKIIKKGGDGAGEKT